MLKRMFATIALCLAACAGLLASATSASAQDDTATYDLQIQVTACDTADCSGDSFTALDGVTVSVTSADGSVDYGSCTTDYSVKPGGCAVMVEPGTTIEAAIDGATLPDGYVALDSPQTYEVPLEKTEVGDVFFTVQPQQDTVPDDQDTDEEAEGADDETEGAEEDPEAEERTPSELPSTGSGADATPATPLIALAGLVALALLGGSATLVMRRTR